MPNKHIVARVSQLTQPTSYWESQDAIILRNGEIGLDSTLGIYKIGDGVSRWIHLPVYKYFTEADANKLDKAVVDATATATEGSQVSADVTVRGGVAEFDFVLPKGEKGSVWKQGTVLTGQDTCSGVEGNVGDCYLNTNTCDVYECIATGSILTAVWKFQSNIKGEDGSSFTVVIESSNGDVFRVTDVDTTLSCRVYMGVEEITDSLEDSRFRWKRISRDPVSDSVWNAKSKAIGHKSVKVTTEDVNGRCTFVCEVDFENYKNEGDVNV